MEFDRLTTAVLFLALVAVGVGGTMIPMQVQDVLMMVLPSALVFGGIVLFLGIKHGEYRARQV